LRVEENQAAQDGRIIRSKLTRFRRGGSASAGF